MAVYRQGARRRRESDELQRQMRAERGWQVARRAAELLRERFQAGRVVVFGSLLRPEHYGARSDVDLAARGTLRSED